MPKGQIGNSAGWLVALLTLAVIYSISLCIFVFAGMSLVFGVEELSSYSGVRIFFVFAAIYQAFIAFFTVPFTSDLVFYKFFASLLGTAFLICVSVGLVRVSGARLLKSLSPGQIVAEPTNVVVRILIFVFMLATLAVTFDCHNDHRFNDTFYNHLLGNDQINLVFIGSTVALAIACFIFSMPFASKQIEVEN